MTCAPLTTTYGSGSCMFELASCSDEHDYTVMCPGGSAACACEVNAKVVTTSTTNFCVLTSDELLPAIDSRCNWNIEVP